MSVPADEQRLREIEERVSAASEEGWYVYGEEACDDVRELLALLRVRKQELAASAYKFECSQAELDECDQRADRVDAQLVAAVREAAELREALREIAKGESYYVGDYMNIARAALEATS